VLNTTGLVSSASIVWTNTLATNGVIMDSFTFSLPVPSGVQTNIPAPTLVFTDGTGTNSWTIQAATPVFNGVFPVQLGTPSIPVGTYGVNTPIQIGLTNPAAAAETGSMTVSITDANGNIVTNVTGNFSLAAGMGTNLMFTAAGDLPVGQYFVTGTLNMNGSSGQAFSGVYVVSAIPFMLQAGWPGLPNTNGMNLSLQGPIYFTSTNSPSYFTDTTTTNSSARFYRAVMVSFTTSAPMLQVQISGSNIILAWPSAAQNYSLQTTTNLADPNSWTTLTNVPAIVSFQCVVTNQISSAGRFYRLRR
jgi:hypothetical protein